MYALGKIKITAAIPDRLKRLRDIAYNMWWSWNNEAIDLYRQIDLALWEKLSKNPVRFLQEVSLRAIDQKLNDEEFLKEYDEVVERFDNYMNQKSTWFSSSFQTRPDSRIVYFSAEYGLHEVLPVYSGGLGVLSGDHCKSASDLGLPFTAIGLFYKQGYFDQRINNEGWQQTNFRNLNYSQLPVHSVENSEGKPLVIHIELPGRVVYARVWRIAIGRISLYLMDADVPENNQYDRALTERLYGGDRETRIQQEILLGIGGIRTLEALGIHGSVYHMNEGHSAFLGLELARKLIIEKNMPFSEARELVISSSVFTTHTPVPAGNDIFPIDMIDRYFSNYWGQLGLQRHEFIRLGLKPSDPHNFNMTVLALGMSGRRNGVSELHGAVSRDIYNEIWAETPEVEVPISHITNGIHTLTWLAPGIKYLFDKHLPSDWKERLSEPSVWDAVDRIPDSELWKTHNVLKTKLIRFIRDRLKAQYLQNGTPLHEINSLDDMIDTNALTIGFARRFATYKRANLIFRDLARIEKLLNNPEKPMQIIFAGKAHPADRPAHEVIKSINDMAHREGFRGKVFLVENYNMTVARNLVQGVDVWMNNPRRPLEASGTSGQKVSINGVLNFSVLDGWWCEGFNGSNGWVIGDDTEYDNEQQQDDADSKSMYEALEKEIIPLYYSRSESGVPIGWVRMMKESIRTLSPTYSTHRMVQDYVNNMYMPSIARTEKASADNFAFIRRYASWKQNLFRVWPQIRIIADRDMHGLSEYSAGSGEDIMLSVSAQLGSLVPDDVRVEIYYGKLKDGELIDGRAQPMEIYKQIDASTYAYKGSIKMDDGGEYGYSFRAVPNHEGLINSTELPLMRWVNI